jgi:small GTP-binding protein
MTMLIIGESSVGKTTLIFSLLKKIFQEHANTIALDLFTTHMTVDGNSVKLKIWDTVYTLLCLGKLK